MCKLPQVVALVIFCGQIVFGAERVEVRFNLPQGIGQYSGTQPVTFGIPFERGALKSSDKLRLVDEQGRVLPGQFEITGVWAEKGGKSDAVRWLLIDTLANIRDGAPAKMFLEYGPDVAPETPATALKVQADGQQASIDTGIWRVDLGARDGGPGRFTLTDGEGKVYRPGGKAGKVEMVVEKNGPVRAVVKFSGNYEADDGSSIAQFITRVRYYANCPFARVYHTLIWTVDEKTAIGSLKLTLPTGNGPAQAGLDGKSVLLNPGGRLHQSNWDTVSGTATGKQLDGWVQAGQTFVALRWPWQQFPVSLAAGAEGVEIGLIGPSSPMSLKAMDVAVEAVKKVGKPLENGGLDSWDINSNVGLASGKPDGKQGWISPRGVAKTYELVIWADGKENPAGPEAVIKNLLAQHPVLAYADPAFATRAAVPSPAAPADAQRYPAVEAALRRAFGWVTMQQARDGDYGTWNWGDIQWQWMEQGGYAVYRYWMNNGKGWPAVPWVLWLRSGDRAYFEHGEANSRHIMDVDTCHVEDWSKEGKPRDGKIKGGVYHYCAVHWAYGPRLLPFYSDSEYLPTYYHLTGYERARDVMMERIDAIRNWPAAFQSLWTMYQDPQKHSRHLYAPTKDMLAFYEATGDPTIGKYARDLVNLILKGQEPNGHFFGVKNNHYFDQTLNLARRVLGDEDGRIAKAIAQWTLYNGDSEAGGPSLNIEDGWASLWSLITTGEQRRDPRYLRLAARIMNAQAAVVDDGDSEWRGISPIFLHEIGPALRDWPIVLAALNKAAPAEQTQNGEIYEAMTYIAGDWPPRPADQAAGWKHRELALLLSEKGEAIEGKIHLWGGGVGSVPFYLRIHAPDGKILIDQERTVTFGDQYGAKDRQTMDTPVALSIPAGRPGVYAVEVLMKTRRPFMHLRPSNGKVVYLFKPKAGNFLISPVYAGQVWFEPLGTEPLVIGFAANQVMGRTSLFGPDGKLLVARQATGTRQVKAADHGLRPEGQPIRLAANQLTAGLHALLLPTPRDKNSSTYISGAKPWFAARRGEWFDPTSHPHPDLDMLMKEK